MTKANPTIETLAAGRAGALFADFKFGPRIALAPPDETGAAATGTGDAPAGDGTTGAADSGTADAGKTADTGTIAQAGNPTGDQAAQDAAAVAAAAAAGTPAAGTDGKAPEGDKPTGKAPDAAAAAGDWRAQMAGGDPEALKRLERFTDPSAVLKSFRELEKKLSSGDVVKKLAPDAKPEEIAAWRKENGIPESEKGYIEAFKSDDGLVLSDEDKPIVEEIATAALAGNMTPDQFSGVVKKYYEIQEAQAIARNDADVAYKQKSDDVLREVWGADYRPNINAVNNLIAGWPGDLATAVLQARTPDGRVIGNDPDFVRQLASISRELNPVPMVVPNNGADPVQAGEARLAELKGWMAAPANSAEHKKYWGDPKVQEEYRTILEGLDKMKARGAA
jgi:hypothetical protein